MLQKYKQLLLNRRFMLMKLILTELLCFTTTLFIQLPDSNSSATAAVFQQFPCMSFR